MLGVQKILVAGAGGAVGFEVARILINNGHEVTATLRTPRAAREEKLRAIGAMIARLDLLHTDEAANVLAAMDAAIFTPILTVSSQAAPLLRPDQRAVFLSSNNVAIDEENEIYAALLTAEKDILAAAPSATILRPTMIYGYPGDGNLARLASAMRRFPIMPLPGSGNALQQPLYYRDLAAITVEALFNGGLAGKVRSVAGRDVLSQRALYAAVAHAVGRRSLVLPTPTKAASLAMSLMEGAGMHLPVKAAQLRRASLDKLPQGEFLTGTTSIKAGLNAMVSDLSSLKEEQTGP